MPEELSPEQQRIGELFGTVDVLESLIVDIIARTAREGSLEDQALKKKLSLIIKESEEPQENAWGEHFASGQRATASRLSGVLKIGQIVSGEAKKGAAGEA